ncbi:MAG: PilW family protein [Gammaproteobacteria bacterium]
MLHTYKQNQIGLSLIELMIAMLVGLILLAGVLSIFLSSRSSYNINSGVAQIQENGRFALNFINAATRQAGYMSCGSSANVTNQLQNNTTLPYNFTQAVYGFEYTGTAPTNTYAIAAEDPLPVGAGNWAGPGLDTNIPVSGPAYAIPGSDVLVVRFAQDASNPAYVADIVPIAGLTTVTTNNAAPIPGGSLLTVSNCVNTVVVQTSNLGPAIGSFTVNAASPYSPGVSSAAIPQSLVGAQVGIVTTDVFYVGQGADGFPALFLLANKADGSGGFAPPQELVPGVENMQLLYGVDTVGGGEPTEYDTANVVTGAGNWANVVSVRAALLLRSATGTVPVTALPPFNLLGTMITAPIDTRLRRVFTTTIAIRN